jgi:hypothetical protein
VIDLQIAALHTNSAANAAEKAHVPQTQAPSPVLPARGISATPAAKAMQDTVSLCGTPLPQQRQQYAPATGNAQPATFTLLAQTTTVRASQNDAAATAPTIQSNAPTVAVAAPAQTPASAATQSPVAKAPTGADATAAVVSASSSAPTQQTLQQLDRVLQQLGIDPQTLSLISREGMLNWVNDPAALRQIVQNVQAAVNRSQQNAAVGSANPAQSTAQLAIASASANQNQIQSQQTQNQPQAALQEANSVSGSSAAASSNNTDALDRSAATAQQNATAVAQFQKLQDSVVPGGTTETQPAATSSGTTTPQGQFLNVSAQPRSLGM